MCTIVIYKLAIIEYSRLSLELCFFANKCSDTFWQVFRYEPLQNTK